MHLIHTLNLQSNFQDILWHSLDFMISIFEAMTSILRLFRKWKSPGTQPVLEFQKRGIGTAG